MEGCIYEFGPYRQDPATRTLTRQGALVEIAPKTFDTLLFLVANSGRTVGREEIMHGVWPDTFVEEGNLNYNISRLRKLLGEYEPGVPYIQTLPKQGYRFVAPVSEVSGKPSEPVPDAALTGAPRRALLAGALTVLAAAILIGILAWRGGARWAASTPHSPALVRLTSDSSLTMTPALSPDGTLVAYASDRGGEGNLRIWVQQLDGAGALRLTSGPADDYAPSFSPDGRSIAFRSEREGGGIYVISTLGGEARKLAPFGRRPRFSPDGKWIAYWIGTDAAGVKQTNFPVPGAANIYVVPSAGGPPQQIRSDFAAAAYPVWTPDGRHILFLGNRDANVLVEPADGRLPGNDSVDWWVTPTAAGPAVATGANAAFRALGLASVSQPPEQWTEDKPGVLMSAALSETQNVWRVPVSPGSWKVSGAPTRLTSGTTMDVQPAVAGKRLVFASLTGSLDVWSVPIESDRAKPVGSLQRLTADAFDHFYPTVSADGRKIAYSSLRSGTRAIWVKDLETGTETAVSAPSGSAFGSVFSPDGGKLAYRSLEKQISAVQIAALDSGSRERVSECLANGGWSSDGKNLLCVGGAAARISMVDLQSRQVTGLINHATWTLWNPRFSPNDQWISFNATAPGRSRIFVAPFRKTGLIPESEWTPITKGAWDDKPRWSPDGNTLYFLSERDGFRCIWAQRLDASGRPAGAAIPIYHAHEARRSLLSVQVGALDMSVARDKIVFNMNERAGNVWMTDLSDRK
jgi:Tol biopolymer transport system component/DNA-binding winged helix-turn-helix (wHTH) protein